MYTKPISFLGPNDPKDLHSLDLIKAVLLDDYKYTIKSIDKQVSTGEMKLSEAIGYKRREATALKVSLNKADASYQRFITSLMFWQHKQDPATIDDEIETVGNFRLTVN